MEMKDAQNITSQNVWKFVGHALWNWDYKMVLMSLARIPLLTIIPFLSIWIPKLILEQLQTANQLVDFLIPIVIAVLLLIVCQSLSKYLEGAGQYRQNTFVNDLLPFVDGKTMDMDYALLESKEGQHARQKAMSAVYESGNRILNIYVFLGNNFFCMVLYSILLLRHSVSLLAVLSGSVLISAWLMQKSRTYEKKVRDSYTPLDQKLRYLEKQTLLAGSQKDIRIYDMKGMLECYYRDFLNQRIKWSEKIKNRQFQMDTLSALVLLVSHFFAYAYLIFHVLNGGMSISDFVLCLGVVTGFSGWLYGFLEQVHQMNRAHLQLGDLTNFLHLKNKTCCESKNELPKDAFQVEFQQVSYRYEGAESDTLHNLNLTIQAGEKLAVVGRNGAGKSTFIKLLCGLYQPTEGRILVNGTDCATYSRDEYFQLFRAVFQDVHILPASIVKNVAMCEEKNIQRDQVENCLRMAGLWDKVAGLSNGMDTFLVPSVYPEAVSLSGGEVQKLVLARALYKDGCFLLLDEPTAALDAVAEDQIYQQYHQIAANCTSVFISHRFASTRFCDHIILLENGAVSEYGTHQELLQKNGRYTEMYQIQSQYYQENAEVNREVMA